MALWHGGYLPFRAVLSDAARLPARVMAVVPKRVWMVSVTRSPANYRNAAKLLAELRDAVGGEEGSRIADQAARQIAKKFPTLRNVKRAFKEEGLNYR